MDIVKLFRTLIVAALGLLASYLIVLLLEPDYPEEIASHLYGEGAGPVVAALESDVAAIRYGVIAVLLAAACAQLSALVGMWSFRPWSRRVYVAVIAFGLLLFPLMGSTFSFPFSGTIEVLLTMCEGALIALLFTDGIRDRFRPDAA